MADLFLVTVRLLQATAGYEFVHPDGADSVDVRPANVQSINNTPRKFEIKLVKV